jgi:catechol 2,3-dioxygenase-like lactoylglutathione lyase family enzyme
VSDLERSKKFYTEVLGRTVGARVPAQGEAVEYLLGMTGDIRADTLIVIRKGEVKPGATDFGTITITARAFHGPEIHASDVSGCSSVRLMMRPCRSAARVIDCGRISCLIDKY